MSTPQRPVAIVSGGNRGLGRATGEALAERGYQVVLGCRDVRVGEPIAAALEGRGLAASAAPLDVTSDQSVQSFARRIEATFGRADVLVASAGVILEPYDRAGVPAVTAAATVLDGDFQQARDTIEVNLFGAYRLIRAIVPMMRRQGSGRVVAVTSGMGTFSDMTPGWPGYRISKTALNALTRILALELQGTNVLVNAVCPGWVRTELGGPKATRSIAEGVAGIVWAATLPDDGPSGGLFRDGAPIPW
jgi:NAD(P)-dependent dehydrogenase (short-subunit alcohol dehydrogenase family)